MALRADALRGARRELCLDEHEAATLLRARVPLREHGRRSAMRKVFQCVGREESAGGALEFGDELQLFLRRLHRILRVIVDRAERLIFQRGGTEVVHQRRIQRRRVDGSRDAAKQDHAGRRGILGDPDVGRQWTLDADGRVLSDPRGALNAVVETIVEEERVIRIVLQTLAHILR